MQAALKVADQIKEKALDEQASALACEDSNRIRELRTSLKLARLELTSKKLELTSLQKQLHETRKQVVDEVERGDAIGKRAEAELLSIQSECTALLQQASSTVASEQIRRGKAEKLARELQARANASTCAQHEIKRLKSLIQNKDEHILARDQQLKERADRIHDLEAQLLSSTPRRCVEDNKSSTAPWIQLAPIRKSPSPNSTFFAFSIAFWSINTLACI